MRMTNEEFQAEVFRRSRAYLAKRQTCRRRLFSGVLAFAGCFAVVFAAAKLLPNRVAKNAAEKTADNAVLNGDNAKNDAVQAESSEEACAEAEPDYAEERADEACEAAGEQVLSSEKSEKIKGESFRPAQQDTAGTAEPAKADGADAAKTDSQFTAMTENELFAYYGINGLPETLAGMNYAGQEKDTSGVQYQNKGTLSDDGTLFRYQDAESGKELLVLLRTMDTVQPDAPQPEDMTLIYAKDTDTDTAVFRIGKLYVTVNADDQPFDTLKRAATELKDYLSG